LAQTRKAMLGHKIRRLRQELGLSQAEMAGQLAISASYLNLIEHNQRAVTVPLLFRLGKAYEIDLKAFAEDEEAQLAAGLKEAFADPLFAQERPRDADLRELGDASPAAASAVLTLYRAYRALREDAQALAERMVESGRPHSLEGAASPLDEVRDFQQAMNNHAPELEAAAEELWADGGLEADDLGRGLARPLEAAHGVSVRVMPAEVMGDALRRYDFHRRRVLLSEALAPASRTFQLAMQAALLGRRELLDRLAGRGKLTSPEAERLARAGLAAYFAGAVLMPYDRFREAAAELRHDISLLERRFGASFEQVCHRLTTLQRPGARGVPFFFIRIDRAGNVSKRLDGGGFRFSRFGGACPRWIVHEAFARPGEVLAQAATMPDGATFFTIARTAEGPAGYRRGPATQFAIGLGCDAKDAGKLVYSDGFDLANAAAATPIGVACRICERSDCAQRAHPPLNQRLRIDENVRRASPFTFAPG
jgi:predicted transcriptional regulator/DNA-binding XRE family transcriptional regulator